MTVPPLAALMGSAVGSFAAGAAKGILGGASQASSFVEHLHDQRPSGAAVSGASDNEETRQSALAKLQTAAIERLRQAGIDVNQPIRFFGGPSGSWMVQGAHPDLLKIERLVQQDDELRSILQQIDAMLNVDKTGVHSFEISTTGITA